MHRKNVPNNVRMGQMNALSSVNNLSDSEKKKIQNIENNEIQGRNSKLQLHFFMMVLYDIEH